MPMNSVIFFNFTIFLFLNLEFLISHTNWGFFQNEWLFEVEPFKLSFFVSVFYMILI